IDCTWPPSAPNELAPLSKLPLADDAVKTSLSVRSFRLVTMIGVSASCVPDAGSKAIGSRSVVVGETEIPKAKETTLLVGRKDSQLVCWVDPTAWFSVGTPSERKYDTFWVPEPLSLPASPKMSIALVSALS